MNLKSPENQESQPAIQKKALWSRFLLAGLGCLVIFVLLGVGLIGSFFLNPERDARSRLDGLLGQGQSSQPEDPSSTENFPSEIRPHVPNPKVEEDLKQGLEDMLSQMPEAVLKGDGSIINESLDSMRQTLQKASQGGIEVKDTAEAIVIEVPVENAEAAKKIEVKASPNWVQISGQTEVVISGSGGKSISTFMRSFNSSDALLPEKMTRKMEMDKVTGQNKLVIKIPKASGFSKSEQHSEDKKQTSPPLPEIEGDPSNMPVDGYI